MIETERNGTERSGTKGNEMTKRSEGSTYSLMLIKT